MHIRRMLLEGSPVIVAMRPQERPSRRRMFCISSAHFRLTPLRRPMCLPVASTRSSPASRPLPGQVPLHLREDDGQVQQRPPHGAVLVDGLPEADNLYSFLPQPAQRLQHLGQRPASGPAPPPSHSSLERGILQAIQPGPVPGGPAAHILEDLLPVGQDASLRAEVVGIGAAAPRFWHDGTILTLPEFRLC